MPMGRIIFLLGYMGCGKTTLGRAVADRSGVAFIDLDEYVEALAGMCIREIFASRGEEAFRRMEREALEELAAREDSPTMIVACGGGTPCFGDNMELMNRLGTTVHLTAPLWRLFERLSVARAERPLIAALDDAGLERFIAEKFDERLPWYSRAAVEFDSTLLDDEAQVEETSQKFIKQFEL